MNLVIKPALSALALSFTLLQGCAYNAPTTDTPKPEMEPEAPKQQTSIPQVPQAKAEPSAEPKAIPFEEVLKMDQAAAQQQPPKKKRIKLTPKPPLRPPQTAPVEKQTDQVEQPAKPVAAPKITKAPAKPAAVSPAPITPATPESPISAPPIQFSLDQLPLTIHNTWILSGGQDACSLKTVPVKMEDGAGKTPVFLQLSSASWLLSTKSDIDLSYSNTGLFFDNGIHIPLESLEKDTKIRFTEQKDKLTEALKTATSMQVTLGFWPTWPVTEPHTHTLPVAHFPQALAAWETCNQRISAR